MVRTGGNRRRGGEGIFGVVRFNPLGKVSVLSGVLVLVLLLAGGLELGRVARAEVGRGVTLTQSDVAEQKARADQLFQWGKTQFRKSQFRESLQSWETALRIYREIGDRQGEVNSLGNLGNAHDSLSQYEQAVDLLQQTLAIAREIQDRRGEAYSLINLGGVYHSQGRYERAIDLQQQSLTITREIGDRQGEADSLGNLGLAYDALGQYERAIDFQQQSLVVAREIGDHQGEATSLGNLGSVHHAQGQYERAIDFHQQHLTIAHEIGDRQGEASSLGSLGGAYYKLGQYEQAIDFYQRYLSIAREIEDPRGKASSLHGLGVVYAKQKRYTKGIAYLQQALALHRVTQARSNEGLALSTLGYYLNALNHPQLAITFYKASVDIREAIRGDITGLDPTLQQSYTDTIADDYRALADLLLQQNRIPEAQRVLDLLKVQELDDYFNGVQRNADTATGIAKRPAEQNILDCYIEIVLAAEELAQLTSRPPKDLSDTERQRLKELNAKQDQLSRSFTAFLDRPDVAKAIAALNPSPGQLKEALEPEHFKQLKDNLANLPQPSALLYPLILPDRLEMVLVLPDAAPVRVAVPVTQAELTQTIIAFGQDLSNPGSDPLPRAQQLHDWLLKDLEPALTAAGVTNLIYAPDEALRYIPLAALYDGSKPNGQRWIAQRYSVSNITAASLIDFDSQPSDDLRLFAGACAECSFSFEVGDRNFNFRNLPATETEVKALAKSFSDNTILLNQDCSPAELKLNRGYYNLLHLATHAAFVEGDPRESFIVFGDGSRVSLRQIREEWDLSNQELIVLSACQTAVGGSQLGNGAEVLGLGYQMQASGAKAALSSLWLVSDSGTQQLMNAFYDALRQDGMSKSPALQQAQMAMIKSDGKGGEGDRASVRVVGESKPGNASLSHPYYWAPFILIGNGL